MPDSVHSEKLVKNICQLCLTKISPDAGKARLCEKCVCVENAPEILVSHPVTIAIYLFIIPKYVKLIKDFNTKYA